VVRVGADDRGRADALNCCYTLDDLSREMKAGGFNLIRSGLYLCLIILFYVVVLVN